MIDAVVYLLFESKKLENERERFSLLGVFESQAAADAAIVTLKESARDPDVQFDVSEYGLNEDACTYGFLTWDEATIPDEDDIR